MLSLLRAWRTDKSAAQFLSSLCKRLPTGARGGVDMSTPNPPFAPKILLSSTSSVVIILSLPLVRYKHDVAVNHVSVSRQLCQAEEECPLLARWRPVSSFEGASFHELECYGAFFLFFFFWLFFCFCFFVSLTTSVLKWNRNERLISQLRCIYLFIIDMFSEHFQFSKMWFPLSNELACSRVILLGEFFVKSSCFFPRVLRLLEWSNLSFTSC